MAKDPLTDYPMDSTRNGRPGSSSKFPSHAGPSRTSVLSSVVPYLRRLDGDETPAHQKTPLLTLKLSSPSFLDSYVTDDVTEQPLYTISTVGTTTTIKRADPWDGDTKTAEIKWPKTPPAKGKGISDGVSIQMRGIRWQGSETLLRRGTILSGPRKFNIPNYSQNLKWRRVGNSYWCTTAAVKGPIAIFEPAIDSLLPQLTVFETLHDKYDARPLLVHHGVSLLLLDYLLVTALFLVTDVQEWMLVKKFEGQDIVIPIGNFEDLPGLSPPRSAPGNVSTTNLQWRKIMYGEPLFPKRASHSSVSSECTTPEAVTPISVSAQQMAKVIYGHPLYPTLRSSSPDPSTSGSEDGDDDLMFFSPSTALTASPTLTRAPSPSSESIFYRHSRGNAPDHTYLDPSFYTEDDVPPVPPLPRHFSISPQQPTTTRSRPSSSHSATSTSTSARRLPELPMPPVLPLIPRPRSTPPMRPMTAPTSPSQGHPDMHMAGAEGPGALAPQRPTVPVTVPVPDPAPPPTPRRPSRQLPRPPTATATAPRSESEGLGRARSHSQSHSIHSVHDHGGEKWRPHPHPHPHASYSQRTLPSPPTSSSRSRAVVPVPVPVAMADSGPVKDEDLRRWMEALAGPAAAAMAGQAYDMPPPAYNSINFGRRGEGAPAPGPAGEAET
ncbi:hypothetical protein LshimejAT787_0400140 [Lyophyllum shimeji]|uniref:Uncharacterized protein n=1 Tax=Lyophyllum shimeji TaxID=47721 RepID=A0A9P3PK59_LYOSH|nr:hypothetical protein LshimejAT787_0400140 [Lyophyllum shimeji]